MIRPRIRRAFRLALRRRDLTDDEVDEELRFHIETRVTQLVARGMTREEAEREARRRFGDDWSAAVARVHDAGHQREDRLDMRERLDALWRDVAYAVRTLGRQPGFAAVVIVTFALGIGANTTMFGIIDRLLLRPPPHIADPHEVMAVGLVYEYQGMKHFGGGMPYPLYTALAQDTAHFRGATVSDVGTFTLGRGIEAEQITAALVGGGYFAMLGTRPVAGRFFLPTDDEERTAAPVAVLSHGFWQRRFAGDRAILGQRLRIGRNEFTVVGVAPPEFTGPEPRRIDVWIPMAAAAGLRFSDKEWATTWDSFWLSVYVRLRPGVGPEVGAARLRAIYTAAQRGWLESKGQPPETTPATLTMRSILPAELLGERAEPKIARLLAAVAAVVLIIASANVANLLLARGAGRRREIAVRLALGVSRARLVRLVLVETALLTIVAGIVATLVAVWGVRLVHATLLDDYAWIGSAPDGRVLAITLLLVVATVVIAGLAPAMHASKPNVTESLKTGGREGSVRNSRARTTLVTVQAALSALLLVGAGLFVRSLRQATSVQLGYEPSRVISARVDLDQLGYNEPDRIAIFTAMRDRVAAMPGVESAALSTTHPLSGSAASMEIEVPGRDSLPQSPRGGPYFNAVSDDYFSTVGLRLLEGRPITSADLATRSPVAVLSAAMARAYWPGASAVGRCVKLNMDSTCTTVVGVADDAREQVRPGPPRFLIYMRMGAARDIGETILLVRSTGDARRLITPIRQAMQTVAPNLPYADIRAFDELLGRQMGQGVRAAAFGVALGSLGALATGRLVADLLFETSPRNPAVFASVAALILTIAIVATFVPAWRAGQVDPVRALKGD